MKHFLVDITYLVPVDDLTDILPQHRTFLQKGYDQGWLLMSGPRLDKLGGIVICRAPSQDALEAFFRDDPYAIHGVAIHRFVEFNPVKRQNWLENWVTED
jgi:uncharacterized protein YciI